MIYAHLIDLTVEFTRLSDWNSWTNRPLATFPRYIEVVEEIPKTPSQKIQKNKLRERGLSASTWDRESVGYRGQTTLSHWARRVVRFVHVGYLC